MSGAGHASRMPSACTIGRQVSAPSSERNSSSSFEATRRSGSLGSTSKSMIRPRGVKCSEKVRPPSSEITIALNTASNAYMRSWLITILCRSAAPRRDTTRQVRPLSSERRKPRKDGSAPCLSGCPEPISVRGPLTFTSRKVPTVDVFPFARDLGAEPLDLVLVGVDLEEPAVGREQEVAALGVDVEGVHEGRLLGEVDEPRRLPRALRPAAARAGQGRRAEHRRDQREAPHVPACASSHSARVVKPTMIASIQYCDLTAKRFCG